MTATRQRAMNILRLMPESEVERFVSLNIHYEQEESSENAEYLAKIDRGIAQKNAGKLQYHDLIDAEL